MLPRLNKGFHYTTQLTLAALSRLAMETPQLFRSQEINRSSVFPLKPFDSRRSRAGELSVYLILSFNQDIKR